MEKIKLDQHTFTMTLAFLTFELLGYVTCVEVSFVLKNKNI